MNKELTLLINMETVATILVVLIIVLLIALNIKYVLALMCILVIWTFIFSGLGILIFCAAAAAELTFAKTPIFSGLIGWVISASLAYLSYKLIDYADL